MTSDSHAARRVRDSNAYETSYRRAGRQQAEERATECRQLIEDLQQVVILLSLQHLIWPGL